MGGGQKRSTSGTGARIADVFVTLDIAELLRSNVRFAVARDDDGRAIGCGAVVFHDGYGELKRMFVHAPHRGQGIARQLLMFLENEAAGRGCPRLMLETGISQPGALGLYENAGYARCEPFGNYADDPFSVFMQRTLG